MYSTNNGCSIQSPFITYCIFLGPVDKNNTTRYLYPETPYHRRVLTKMIFKYNDIHVQGIFFRYPASNEVQLYYFAFSFCESVWILKCVPSGSINNIPALVQIMAWRRSGDKPLSEPRMVRLPIHICVTRPQWVNVITKENEKSLQTNLFKITNWKRQVIHERQLWTQWNQLPDPKQSCRLSVV